MTDYKLISNGWIKKLTGDNETFFSEKHSELWSEYQAWLDRGNTPKPLLTKDEAKVEAIALVKAEAQKRINAIAPEWKQQNMTARAIQLVRIDSPTAEDVAEMDAIEAVFAGQINPVRDASDVIESEVNSKLKVETIQAIDITNHPAWP